MGILPSAIRFIIIFFCCYILFVTIRKEEYKEDIYSLIFLSGMLEVIISLAKYLMKKESEDEPNRKRWWYKQEEYYDYSKSNYEFQNYSSNQSTQPQSPATNTHDEKYQRNLEAKRVRIISDCDDNIRKAEEEIRYHQTMISSYNYFNDAEISAITNHNSSIKDLEEKILSEKQRQFAAHNGFL